MEQTEMKMFRMFDTVMRASESEEMIVEGYPVIFNSETQIGSGKSAFKEKIARGVLQEADLSDAVLSKNHKDAYARVSNGTLELVEDDIGIRMKAKIIDTTAGIDFFKEVKSGLITRMSFFASIISDWDYSGAMDSRTIKRFKKVFDVSAVIHPAYKDTFLIARSEEEQAFRQRQLYERQIEKLNQITGGKK